MIDDDVWCLQCALRGFDKAVVAARTSSVQR